MFLRALTPFVAPSLLLFLLSPFAFHLIPLTLALPRHSRPVPADAPYIRCPLCPLVSAALLNATQRLVSLPSNHRTPPSELDLYDLVEALCDPQSLHGTWLKQIDLVEVQAAHHTHLTVQFHPHAIQKCKQECRTSALACTHVLDGLESDLAETLYSALNKNKNHNSNNLAPIDIDLAYVENWLCHKRTGKSTACKYSVPPLPKHRPTGPPFVPDDSMAHQLDEEKVRMQTEMDDLAKKTGQKMRLYSKDDLGDLEGNINKLKRAAGEPVPDDDDDDEDDDEL